MSNLLTNAKVDSPIAKICMAAWRAGLSSFEMGYCMSELSMDILDDFRYQSKPVKPTMLDEYHRHIKTSVWASKTNEQQDKITKHVFGDREVDKYIKEVARIDGENDSNLKWLAGMLDRWKDMDEKEKFVKVWSVYMDYPSDMVNPKRWGAKDKKTTVQKVKDVFGGRIVNEKKLF